VGTDESEVENRLNSGTKKKRIVMLHGGVRDKTTPSIHSPTEELSFRVQLKLHDMTLEWFFLHSNHHAFPLCGVALILNSRWFEFPS
jgi:hypothetical protein